MNFFTDDPLKNKIKYVHITIHTKCIIVRINDEKNKLYDHQEYRKVIKDLEDIFPKDKLEYMLQYIIDNLEYNGIKVDLTKDESKDNGQQLSLF